MDLIALSEGIISMSLTNTQIIEISLIIIVFAFLLIILGLILLFIASKRNNEELTAFEILKNINNRRSGKEKKSFFSIPKINLSSKNKKVSKNENNKNKENKNKENNKNLKIKKDEVSLKELLMVKFKPKIEKQLKTKVVIEDFNAGKDEFIVKVDIQGHKLELKLDSSGKIIDYKNLSKN